MATNATCDDGKTESFKILKIEFDLYQQFISECNGADMMMKSILTSFNKGDVPASLYSMYHEAAYGTDKNIKRRMRNRMYYIGKKIRYVFLSYIK